MTELEALRRVAEAASVVYEQHREGDSPYDPAPWAKRQAAAWRALSIALGDLAAARRRLTEEPKSEEREEKSDEERWTELRLLRDHFNVRLQQLGDALNAQDLNFSTRLATLEARSTWANARELTDRVEKLEAKNLGLRIEAANRDCEDTPSIDARLKHLSFRIDSMNRGCDVHHEELSERIEKLEGARSDMMHIGVKVEQLDERIRVTESQIYELRHAALTSDTGDILARLKKLDDRLTRVARLHRDRLAKLEKERT